jgi:N-acetylglucosamine-6-phosphate deacetylase
MSEETIHAWHTLTRQPVRLRHKDGKIIALDAVSEKPRTDLWLAPSLLELQVNGYGGVSFQGPDTPAEELLLAVDRLHRDGCGAALLTIITKPWEQILSQVRHVIQLRKESLILRKGIFGFHIEGPFMSPEPGFVGAHNPDYMESPTPEKIRALREAAEDLPILLTVAVERPGVLENIALATSLGIRVALGHTNAPVDRIRAAIDAGAVAFTHFGNGCTQTLDRHDNILWRIFDSPKLVAGIIPDTVHVSPMLFRLMHRALPSNRIYYTTDAVNPAGIPPGLIKMGDKDFYVGEDQVVREPGKSHFCGSAARCIEVAFRAAEMLSCPWQDAWARYTVNPAHLIGIDWELKPGADATFCLLDMVGPYSGQYTMFVRGEKRPPLPARARLSGAGM